QRLPRNVALQIITVVEDPSLPETADRLDALSQAVSRLSSQVALAGIHSAGAAPIREFRFMRLDGRRVGAVMVTMGGELLRHGFTPSWEVTAQKLEGLAGYFNEKGSFMTLPQARRLFCREASAPDGPPMAREACAVAMALETAIATASARLVFVEGVQNLFSHMTGEGDMVALRAASAALGEKEKLMALLDQLAREPGESVMVGGESRIEEFFGCSVVAHPFAGPHGVEGAIGVIGKKRMDYGFARALVSLAARRLTRSLGGAEKWS
ncbi:MAG: hypothetical protein OEV92_13380, partial [Nitrospinota bacterium]|nr:hypothetical protein [Nitrospinota bacterium]